MSSAWCQLGAASINRGVLTVRCKGGAVDENGAAPDFGDAPMVCALGVTAMPYPPTAEGAVEALLHKTIQGISGVVYGARDTRSAKIVGALKPGDTVLHSTGPQEAAQVQLKEEKRIAAILTKTGSGKTMMLLLDGTEENVQIAHPSGSVFQMAKNGSVSLLDSKGGGLLIQDGNVHFLGNPVLGAGNAPGFCFALMPPSPSPGGIATPPMFPCMGVTPGT